jgi:hypothetical protein
LQLSLIFADRLDLFGGGELRVIQRLSWDVVASHDPPEMEQSRVKIQKKRTKYKQYCRGKHSPILCGTESRVLEGNHQTMRDIQKDWEESLEPNVILRDNRTNNYQIKCNVQKIFKGHVCDSKWDESLRVKENPSMMIERDGQEERIGEVEKELIEEDRDGEVRGHRIKEKSLSLHFSQRRVLAVRAVWREREWLSLSELETTEVSILQ